MKKYLNYNEFFWSVYYKMAILNLFAFQRRLQIQKQGFSAGSVVKKQPANAGDTGSIPAPGTSHMLQSN